MHVSRVAGQVSLLVLIAILVAVVLAGWTWDPIAMG
jgi:hypothetical protein